MLKEREKEDNQNAVKNASYPESLAVRVLVVTRGNPLLSPHAEGAERSLQS